MVKKRSIALFILLSIVTLGIYPLVVYCIMGEEVNRICEGDGKENMFYLLSFLLGLITFGIVPLIWFYKAMNRLQDNAYRYGPNIRPAYSGNQFLLWTLLGAFLFGIGPIVAIAYFISDVNQFADIYGSVQPLRYTANQAERAMMLSNGAFANQQQHLVAPPAAAPMGVDTYTGSDFSQIGSADMNEIDSNKPTNRREKTHSGVIRCEAGMYSGYDFPIESGEEISIGTNPTMASIVVDMNNQNISPKHCVIVFDENADTYLVNDVSDFGTYTMDGVRIPSGMPKVFSRGERIYLGDQQNVFRLG